MILDNPANGNAGLMGTQIPLAKGEHAVDIRYAWVGNGRATLEWFWTPPGGQRELVPPTVLVAGKRSWLRDEAPDVPPAQIPQSQPPTSEVERREPARVMGGLRNPRGIAVDADGNVYVGDRGNGRIVVFDREGREVRSWGRAAPQGAQAGPDELVDVSDVAVGPGGTVYVMDLGANRLQLFDREGRPKLTLPADIVQTSAPNGITVSPDGRVYIASSGQSRVLRFEPVHGLTDTERARAAQGMKEITGTEAQGRIEQPVDVAVDPADPNVVYVADLRDRIVQLDAEGNSVRQWPVPVGREDGAARIAVSTDGARIYITDPDRNRVAVLAIEEGSFTYFGGTGGDNGQLRSPGGIAVGADGLVYVLDRGNGRVQVFEP
jgi:DNA-binding beta-propeller fold protein YncE